MNPLGYIVYGRDHGRTSILCPREVNHFRRSWVGHERCTSVGDEEDYIGAFETVRIILTEGRKAGGVDFYTGGDVNIELKLGNANEDLHCLDNIERCRMLPHVKKCDGYNC